MRLLVLGGTRFLGHHLVETALERGHDVTLFNRGLTRPDPVPGVENLRGDRDGGLGALGKREWDLAVDTSGYFPRIVGASANYLADRVGLYLFFSTISVYADFSAPGLVETSAVATTSDPTREEVTGETYGPLKALCEAEVHRALPGRALVIRPGLIVGPNDPTDRFTYWPVRVAAGGEVLAPGRANFPVQFIDVRDLAAWSLDLAEAGRAGTFHATDQPYAVTLGDLLEASRDASASEAGFTWVPEGFLLQQGVKPWTDLPLWVPEDRIGLVTVNPERAFGAGLTTRPLAETVRDTLAWAQSRPPAPLRAGLAPDREREVLRAWHEVGTTARDE